MKIKLHIKHEFLGLEYFMRSLPECYDHIGELVYSGRNEVRVVSIAGQVMAIKYFKRMTLANRFIYATVRKSKAKRAFEHTEWLLRQGISSPENVAYVNLYKACMLRKAFYVSLFTDYQPLKNLLVQPLSESEEGLKAFARFTYKLHKLGVYHFDYSNNNVLYKVMDGKYDFSLIDNNRMKKSSYSFRKGMKNLNRMAIPVEGLGIVAGEYARVAGVDDLETLNAMVLIRLIHNGRMKLKKWLKMPLVLLKRI